MSKAFVPYPTLGLRCAHVDILLLPCVLLLSNGDLNKSIICMTVEPMLFEVITQSSAKYKVKMKN